MDMKRLGSSGLKVSAVGLGCNNFGMRIDAGETKAVVSAALDAGITLFDTADIYGGRGTSEEFLGAALGPRRKDIVLATKFRMPMGDGPYMQGGSRRYIMTAVEASLRRLQTDHIDLYQIHFPDDETPIAETLGALTDLIRQGKVRYIGCSNFAGWQVADAAWTAMSGGHACFVSAQNHYNLLDRRIEKDLIPAAKHFGLGVLPYFPLASGLLTGKYRRGEAPPNDSRLAAWGERGQGQLKGADWDRIEQLEAFAKAAGKTLLDVAIGWLASQPHVSSVISGATKPEQIAANVAAGGWAMTDEELDEVNKIMVRL